MMLRWKKHGAGWELCADGRLRGYVEHSKASPNWEAHAVSIKGGHIDNFVAECPTAKAARRAVFISVQEWLACCARVALGEPAADVFTRDEAWRF